MYTGLKSRGRVQEVLGLYLREGPIGWAFEEGGRRDLMNTSELCCILINQVF